MTKLADAEILVGRVAWVFGDDFDVDLVIGVDNIKLTDPAELHQVVMRSFDPDFTHSVREGDFFVGGTNFGYGHPHFVAMTAARNEGIAGVIAESFSPGFWRGEIGNGMLLLAVPGITRAVRRWDELQIDWRRAQVTVGASTTPLRGTLLSEATIATLEAGGRYQQLLDSYHSGTVTVARRQAKDTVR